MREYTNNDILNWIEFRLLKNIKYIKLITINLSDIIMIMYGPTTYHRMMIMLPYSFLIIELTTIFLSWDNH